MQWRSWSSDGEDLDQCSDSCLPSNSQDVHVHMSDELRPSHSAAEPLRTFFEPSKSLAGMESEEGFWARSRLYMRFVKLKHYCVYKIFFFNPNHSMYWTWVPIMWVLGTSNAITFSHNVSVFGLYAYGTCYILTQLFLCLPILITINTIIHYNRLSAWDLLSSHGNETCRLAMLLIAIHSFIFCNAYVTSISRNVIYLYHAFTTTMLDPTIRGCAGLPVEDCTIYSSSKDLLDGSNYPCDWHVEREACIPRALEHSISYWHDESGPFIVSLPYNAEHHRDGIRISYIHLTFLIPLTIAASTLSLHAGVSTTRRLGNGFNVICLHCIFWSGVIFLALTSWKEGFTLVANLQDLIFIPNYLTAVNDRDCWAAAFKNAVSSAGVGSFGISGWFGASIPGHISVVSVTVIAAIFDMMYSAANGLLISFLIQYGTQIMGTTELWFLLGVMPPDHVPVPPLPSYFHDLPAASVKSDDFEISCIIPGLFAHAADLWSKAWWAEFGLDFCYYFPIICFAYYTFYVEMKFMVDGFRNSKFIESHSPWISKGRINFLINVFFLPTWIINSTTYGWIYNEVYNTLEHFWLNISSYVVIQFFIRRYNTVAFDKHLRRYDHLLFVWECAAPILSVIVQNWIVGDMSIVRLTFFSSLAMILNDLAITGFVRYKFGATAGRHMFWDMFGRGTYRHYKKYHQWQRQNAQGDGHLAAEGREYHFSRLRKINVIWMVIVSKFVFLPYVAVSLIANDVRDLVAFVMLDGIEDVPYWVFLAPIGGSIFGCIMVILVIVDVLVYEGIHMSWWVLNSTLEESGVKIQKGHHRKKLQNKIIDPLKAKRNERLMGFASAASPNWSALVGLDDYERRRYLSAKMANIPLITLTTPANNSAEVEFEEAPSVSTRGGPRCMSSGNITNVKGPRSGSSP